MSYILDALKKAEQEREIGRVPGIVSGHEQAGGRGISRWVWGVAGVLIINAIVLAIVLWPRPDPRLVVAPAVAAVVPPVAQQKPVITPLAPPTPKYRAPVVPVAPPVASGKLVKPAPYSENRPPVALRPLPPLAEPAPVVVEQVPLVSVAESELVPRNDNLPVWPQVSGSLFQEINTTLHLDVHVYSDLPGQRFVLINMQKYNEGEQLQEGPIVDEITQKDVILSFHGQRFRVQQE